MKISENGCVLKCAIVLATLFSSGHEQDFGYDGNDGPSHWGNKYQHCVGKHQSPINIVEHNVRLVHLPPMVLENFNKAPKRVFLQNNGHTVIATMEAENKPHITGGPLIGNYEFIQFHFHWGVNDDEGSENTINNSSFPLELHMVFYEKDYGSMKEAIDHPDGLTVLSILFSRSDEINGNYENLLQTLTSLKHPNTTATMKNPPSLMDLMPTNISVYYTYGGSLTTPPCLEVVTWIEFKNTVLLAHQQIEMFRHLNDKHGKILHNFRPVQPLHGRVIRMHRDTRILHRSHLNNMHNQECSIYNTNTKYIIIIMSLLKLLILIRR